ATISGAAGDDGVNSYGVSVLQGDAGHDYYNVLGGQSTIQGGGDVSTITVNPSAYAEIYSSDGQLYIGHQLLKGDLINTPQDTANYYYIGGGWWALDGGSYVDIFGNGVNLTARIMNFHDGQFGIHLVNADSPAPIWGS